MVFTARRASDGHITFNKTPNLDSLQELPGQEVFRINCALYCPVDSVHWTTCLIKSLIVLQLTLVVCVIEWRWTVEMLAKIALIYKVVPNNLYMITCCLTHSITLCNVLSLSARFWGDVTHPVLLPALASTTTSSTLLRAPSLAP